MAVLEALPV